MVKAKVFVYAKPFEGIPTKEHLKLIEEDLPSLKDGGKHFSIMLPHNSINSIKYIIKNINIILLD